MIAKGLVVGPFQSNCFIIGSEETKEGMVIDPGASGKKVVQHAEEMGLTIVIIVATHSHIDHIGALADVKEATGAQFAIHADEVETLRGGGMGGLFGLGGGKPPPEPDRLLHDGEVIELGELSLTVLHTPGHSPGGISLVGHGLVFCGDTLFNYGIGRTDFPGCSHEQLMESIRTKLLTLPDDTIVLPGHGPQTTIGEERQGNPWLRG